MENWFKKTPEDFLFSVKVPKEITHTKKLIDCEDLFKDFYSVCKNGLDYKLGAILFQFPPSYHYSPENLQSKMNSDFENVVEFRHQSSWIPEAWNALVKNNITFCSVSHPQLPETFFATFPLIYIRLHGNEKKFYSSYSTEELNTISNFISKNTKKNIPLF